MNLCGLWSTSYYQDPSHLTPWKSGDTFDTWWARAKLDFDNGRATTFYRYMLAAFRDLYGVDFDHISDSDARELDRRISKLPRPPLGRICGHGKGQHRIDDY